MAPERDRLNLLDAEHEVGWWGKAYKYETGRIEKLDRIVKMNEDMISESRKSAMRAAKTMKHWADKVAALRGKAP